VSNLTRGKRWRRRASPTQRGAACRPLENGAKGIRDESDEDRSAGEGGQTGDHSRAPERHGREGTRTHGVKGSEPTWARRTLLTGVAQGNSLLTVELALSISLYT
jgi:hypothetical protein